MDIIYKPTRLTPEVLLDFSKQYFKVSGASSPENSLRFYYPIIDVIKAQNPVPSKLKVEFRYTHFNTSSSKCIYDLLKELKNLEKKGTRLSIDWYYDEDDEDMLECGEDFSDLLSLEFNFIEEEL